MTKVRGVSKNLDSLNKDLALDSKSGVRRNNSSAGSSRVSDMSLQERLKLKDQIREWKNKKLEDDKKVDLERVAQEKIRK